MKTQGRRCRVLIGYLMIFVLAVIITGCGGGDTPSGGTNTSTGLVEITARTGPIIAVRVNTVVSLDGSKSSTSTGGGLTFAWSFSSKPVASTTELQNATTVSPSFLADVKGTYIMQLVVSSGGISSERAIQTIIVTEDGERATGPFNHATLSTSGEAGQGLSSQCGNCHDGVQLLANGEPIAGKSKDHLATSNMCQTCHTTLGFAIIPFVDHLEVFGNCSECHNGLLAIGKSEWHVPTTAECDDCHNTTAFLELGPDGKFDHSGIARACSTCHTGTTAIGKHELHIVTDTDCGFCHNTTGFIPASVDHTGPEVVGKMCSSCHDGANANIKGPSLGHPVTIVDCGICHNTRSFNMGGVFDHSVVITTDQTCESCHNDNTSISATAKPLDHFVTSADCGNCHKTSNFLPAFLDHTIPPVTDNTCEFCHNGTDAVGKSGNHMPTTEDCGLCHTPGTFTSGFYDHAGVTNNCISCHDGVISGGKPFNHIPTVPVDQDCSVCHLSTITFAGAIFSHTGITSNCASCHDDNIVKGKKVNHIPTQGLGDCSVCHADTTAFKTTIFAHQGISNNCENCHDGRYATGKVRATHIPTQEDCAVCHTSTTSFIGATFDHTGLNRGCEGCHNGKFTTATITVAGKPVADLVTGEVGHFPTNQDCHFCHNTTAFLPANFAHVGITGNCVSCHDGTYIATGALGIHAAHLETNGTDCGACHRNSDVPPTFKNFFVDHTSASVTSVRCDSCHNNNPGAIAGGVDIGHVPTNGQDCNVCHVPGGTFASAVFNHSTVARTTRCDTCHNGTDAIGTQAKTNPSHIDIGTPPLDCRDCHNTTAFAGAKFNHDGIVDNCASCHNGATAIGKGNTHVPTNDDCSVCHETTGFIPGTFDHVGIVGNCASCHDGVFAIGKINNHVPTIQDCGACHNTRTFIGAKFDHSTVAVTTLCESCHNGTDQIGKDAKTNPGHIPTTLDCRDCHTTATFVGGTWVHDASTAGNCKNCHDGTQAIGQPTTGHFVTVEQCDRCHSTRGWAPTSFTHSATGNYPGDHARNLTCRSCHTTNSENISYRSPTYVGFCASCHSNKYKTGDHGGRSLATNKDCGRSGCHRVSSRGF